MFGKRLKELRTESGLTQLKLAKILDCDQSMITRWESGECEPTENYIFKTAIYFKVSADYLLGLEDESGVKISNSFNKINNISHNSGNITIK